MKEQSYSRVEKAHPRIMDVFLQILDAARSNCGDRQTLNFEQLLCLMNLKHRLRRAAQACTFHRCHSGTARPDARHNSHYGLNLRPHLTEKIVFPV